MWGLRVWILLDVHKAFLQDWWSAVQQATLVRDMTSGAPRSPHRAYPVAAWLPVQDWGILTRMKATTIAEIVSVQCRAEVDIFKLVAPLIAQCSPHL